MSHWIGACVTRPLFGGRAHVLQASFGYQSSMLGKRVFHVPVGFKTDFASIPRAAWSFLPPFGQYMAAAVIHDWLYWAQPVTREEADQVLLDAMIYSGVNVVSRQIIYRAVRAFGWLAWRNNAKAKARGENRIFDPSRDSFLALLDRRRDPPPFA